MTEFGLIDHIKGLCSALPTNSFEGIGDDCAIFEMGEEALLFTSDMLIERVHFLRDATSPYDLGRKSLAVNLSDVAAMGAQPIATLLSLSIPKELTGGWIEEFMRGYTELSAEHGVALIGGDTTSAKTDLGVNVTAIGRCAKSNVKRRSAAKDGDVIFVSGLLGGSGAGLADILEGRYDSREAMIHKRPSARVLEGVWLGGRSEVNAMMDISDGVASDLRHILKASSVGAQIELSQIPHSDSVTLQQALCSGEDYELLFTVAAEEAQAIELDYQRHFGKSLYPIGKIVAGDCDILWLQDGTPRDGDFRGFTHY
ncbi:MAG: thiamine-phosphate kinase [Rikenellaceae bacterium]